MDLLTLAIAPVLVGLFYIYIRDKYEKEPLELLFTGVVYGVVITAPIARFENLITLFVPNGGILTEAFYMSYVVAAFVEEAFKFIVLYFLVWRDKNLNEPFDGIVYAVFISLGFAGVENILYVMNSQFGGISTAFSRGFISVPAHGIFGVAMGVSFAMAKFESMHTKRRLFTAFFVPWFIHGTYDFILLSRMSYMMGLLGVFVAFLWLYAGRKISRFVELSPFKGRRIGEEKV
ncbi:MAG: PrsW family intramembrane metalloprotease [Clostridiales bacterium]|jgi:RsiW-degrading membrane proteinase PrsW (M82 family)|nr:PrsW family intramembrane metalloprotease [Clostridiales bacterium]